MLDRFKISYLYVIYFFQRIVLSYFSPMHFRQVIGDDFFILFKISSSKTYFLNQFSLYISLVSHLANPLAMFGEEGFTLNLKYFGCTTKSISSIGIAPNKHWSPKTIAPTKQILFSKTTFIGPT